MKKRILLCVFFCSAIFDCVVVYPVRAPRRLKRRIARRTLEKRVEVTERKKRDLREENRKIEQKNQEQARIMQEIQKKLEKEGRERIATIEELRSLSERDARFKLEYQELKRLKNEVQQRERVRNELDKQIKELEAEVQQTHQDFLLLEMETLKAQSVSAVRSKLERIENAINRKKRDVQLSERSLREFRQAVEKFEGSSAEKAVLLRQQRTLARELAREKKELTDTFKDLSLEVLKERPELFNELPIPLQLEVAETGPLSQRMRYFEKVLSNVQKLSVEKQVEMKKDIQGAYSKIQEVFWLLQKERYAPKGNLYKILEKNYREINEKFKNELKDYENPQDFYELFKRMAKKVKIEIKGEQPTVQEMALVMKEVNALAHKRKKGPEITPSEFRLARDTWNIFQNPISKETYDAFLKGEKEVKKIELDKDTMDKLQTAFDKVTQPRFDWEMSLPS